jgi:hypothetical protein
MADTNLLAFESVSFNKKLKSGVFDTCTLYVPGKGAMLQLNVMEEAFNTTSFCGSYKRITFPEYDKEKGQKYIHKERKRHFTYLYGISSNILYILY